MFEVIVEDAILGGALHRGGGEAEHHQRAPDGRAALGLRIEFRVADQVQAADRLPGEIARHRHLHLARHGLLVDRLDLIRPFRRGAGEGGVAALEENLGLAGVAWGHDLNEHHGAERGDERRQRDPGPGAAQHACDLRDGQAVAGAAGPRWAAGRDGGRISRQPEARHGQSLRKAERGPGQATRR